MADTEKPGHALADDVLGFGGAELITVRDLVLRPSTVLQAWMDHGAHGGGSYARPLRLYLALNAILMLLLFLRGGAGYMLDGLPAGFLDPLLASSGKSRDAFIADADGWMTLVMVPLLSFFYALASAPLLRLWDKADLGWRRGFRAAFGWLCAWTVLILPIAWWGYGTGPLAGLVSLAIIVLGIAAFLRMGRGRWFTSWFGGAGKALLLMICVQIAGLLGGALVVGIGLLGAAATP